MRLIVVAQGETVRAREVVFGDDSDLRTDVAEGVVGSSGVAGSTGGGGGGGRVPPRWWSAPEPACRQTAQWARSGAEPEAEVIAHLAGPDFGAWRGRSIEEVMGLDPDGLQQWLRDPEAAPHGGESLAALVARVGAVMDHPPVPGGWPDAGATLAVSPLVARAAVVHALAAAPESLLHVDVAPLGVVRLGREAGRWRLSGLDRPGRESPRRA